MYLKVQKTGNHNNLGAVSNWFAKEEVRLEMNLNRNSYKKIAINVKYYISDLTMLIKQSMTFWVSNIIYIHLLKFNYRVNFL